MRVPKTKFWLLAVFFCGLSLLPARVFSAEKKPQPDRHYFERCTVSAIANVKQGMTREEVRRACNGFEFIASESINKGFVFTADSKRIAKVTIPGWLPAEDQKIDFLCSKQIVVMAYYNKENIVEYVTRFPMHQQ